MGVLAWNDVFVLPLEIIICGAKPGVYCTSSVLPRLGSASLRTGWRFSAEKLTIKLPTTSLPSVMGVALTISQSWSLTAVGSSFFAGDGIFGESDADKVLCLGEIRAVDRHKFNVSHFG